MEARNTHIAKTASILGLSYEDCVKSLPQITSRVRGLPIEAALAEWGFDISHNSKNYYHSPFSKGGDSNPSFLIHPERNTAKDFSRPDSPTYHGVIDLGLDLGMGRSIPEIISGLVHLVDRKYEFTPATLEAPKGRESRSSGEAISTELVVKGPAADRRLLEYAASRGIPEEVFSRYALECEEVRRYADGSTSRITEIGFPNSLGGYSLRRTFATKVPKRTEGRAGITFLNSEGKVVPLSDVKPTSEKLVITEGFFNFLSLVTLKGGLECDTVILNGVGNAGMVEPFINGYREVDLYNDNDTAGLRAAINISEYRREARGVDRAFSPSEVEWVRRMVRMRLSGVIESKRDSLRSERGEAFLATPTAGDMLAEAYMTEADRLHLPLNGTGTRMTVEEFLQSLTPDNLWKLREAHNLTDDVNVVLFRRLSSRESGGLVVDSPYADAIGTRSFSHSLYGKYNDLNDCLKSGIHPKEGQTGNIEQTEKKDKKMNIPTVREALDIQKKNDGMVPFEFSPYTPDRKTVTALGSLPWEQISRELNLDPNLERFIEDQSRRGKGVLEAFAFGGYTSRPVPRVFPTGHVLEGPHFDIIHFRPGLKSANDWQAFTIPCDVVFEKKDRRDEKGNHIRLEYEEKGYRIYEHTGDFMFVKDGKLSPDVAKEIGVSGRYNGLVDPKSGVEFTNHTDEKGNVYTIARSSTPDHQTGDLLKNGEMFATRDKAVLVRQCEYNPDVLLYCRAAFVEQWLKLHPVITLPDGREVEVTKEQATVLAGGGDIPVEGPRGTEYMHYDLVNREVRVGTTYEACLREEVARKREESIANRESLANAKAQGRGNNK